MKNKSKIIYCLLLALMMTIISITSKGVYSYFTFGEETYGQQDKEDTNNITRLNINYIDGLITGKVKITLTKFIYDPPKIKLLNKDGTAILDSLNNEVVLDCNAIVGEDGAYTCQFNNDKYKAFKYTIVGYSNKGSSSEIKYISGNNISCENIMFKRSLTINYYDKTNYTLELSDRITNDNDSSVNEIESGSLGQSDGKWRNIELNFDSLCATGSTTNHTITVGSKTYIKSIIDQNKTIWIKNGKVYDYEPPEEHKITFIIDSDLNKYSDRNIFDLSNFPGIAVTTGTATKIDGKYTFSTTYEETDDEKFGFSFEVDGNRFVHNIRNIKIPTWDEGKSTVDYPYSDQYFNNLSDGGTQGDPHPPLTVSQDEEGNVTVIVRIVEKNSQ